MRDEPVNIWQAADALPHSGYRELSIAKTRIRLDLSNMHERRYVAWKEQGLHYPQGDIDRFLYEHFIQPSDKVLDAGANIGFTALEAIECGASEVLCIEALPNIAERIRSLLNPKISIIQAALSHSIGVTRIAVSISHNQGSTYLPEIIDTKREIFGEEICFVEVPTTTIDQIYSGGLSFDVWKMDIEGAEYDALLGARNTLRLSPPKIIIAELHQLIAPQFIETIREFLPYGYRALIHKSDYSLRLCDPLISELSEYEPHSPMYLFSRAPILNFPKRQSWLRGLKSLLRFAP